MKTNPARQTLERIHSEIITSEIFRLDGAKIDLPAKLIDLADAITADEDENKWSIGEHTIVTLDDLVTGAYWSLVEWHGGQYSDTYAALCALGCIGYGSGPQEETAEWDAYGAYDAYDAINNHFQHLTVSGL